jgi:ferritin-like metal-binding protein YciE
MPSDSLETLHDLFVHELRDLYDAENQLVKALPLMSQAANSDELKRAFDTIYAKPKSTPAGLNRCFRARRTTLRQILQGHAGPRGGGEGTPGRGRESDVMDAALIVAAQKVEHYEIAGYGSVCTFGELLGYQRRDRNPEGNHR